MQRCDSKLSKLPYEIEKVYQSILERFLNKRNFLDKEWQVVLNGKYLSLFYHTTILLC